MSLLARSSYKLLNALLSLFFGFFFSIAPATVKIGQKIKGQSERC